MMFLMKFLARLFSPDFFARAKATQVLQLVTITISHYVEFARWALKAGNIPFEETSYAPGQHVLPVLALRVFNNTGKKYLSSSSCVANVSEANTATMTKEEKKKAGKKGKEPSRATSVPVAVLPDGKVLLDSWEIAQFSKLPAMSDAEKKFLDEDIGPLARQYTYFYLLKEEHSKTFDALITEGRHWFWRLCWFLFMKKSLRKTLRDFYQLDDPETFPKCKARLDEAMKKADKMVLDKKTNFIAGEKLGLVDIGLASLVAPMVCAPKYANGVYEHLFDRFLQQDEEFRSAVDQWRSSHTGKYVMELYSKHR